MTGLCHTPPLSEVVYAESLAIAPHRDRGADGTCPSPAHSATSPNSDHEPNAEHFSEAIDLDHSPETGFDCSHWSEVVANNVLAGKEDRPKYLIFNRRIFQNGRWRPFYGQPHTDHWHTSWRPGVVHDVRPFLLDKTTPAPVPVPVPVPEEDDMLIVDPTRDKAGKAAFFTLDKGHRWILCHNGARLKGDELVWGGKLRVWKIPGTGELLGMALRDRTVVVCAHGDATYEAAIQPPAN